MLVYDNISSQIKTELNAALSVSLSTDSWTSENSYITVNAHFINDKWEGKSYNLITTAMHKAHTSINLAKLTRT